MLVILLVPAEEPRIGGMGLNERIGAVFVRIGGVWVLMDGIGGGVLDLARASSSNCVNSARFTIGAKRSGVATGMGRRGLKNSVLAVGGEFGFSVGAGLLRDAFFP